MDRVYGEGYGAKGTEGGRCTGQENGLKGPELLTPVLSGTVPTANDYCYDETNREPYTYHT